MPCAFLFVFFIFLLLIFIQGQPVPIELLSGTEQLKVRAPLLAQIVSDLSPFLTRERGDRDRRQDGFGGTNRSWTGDRPYLFSFLAQHYLLLRFGRSSSLFK